jgi:hypothetical protein
LKAKKSAPPRGSTKLRASAAKPTDTKASRSAPAQLAEFFRRNGYLRRQDQQRLKDEGYVGYKKGDELRFVANSKSELTHIRHLLTSLGFKPAKPFEKSNQFRQPIYSRMEIQRLMRLMRIKG